MAAPGAGLTEVGSEPDNTAITFSLKDEDHTLGNALRYMLNKDPRVAFCGYSVPHPSEQRVNVRVQTTGESARAVFKSALSGLAVYCNHVRTAFEKAVEEHKGGEGTAPVDKMEEDSD